MCKIVLHICSVRNSKQTDWIFREIEKYLAIPNDTLKSLKDESTQFKQESCNLTL